MSFTEDKIKSKKSNKNWLGIVKVSAKMEWIIAQKYWYLWHIELKILNNAKKEILKSKPPNSILSKIWKLADVKKNGMLNSDECWLTILLK